MKLADLQDNMEVTYRTSRRDNEEGDAPEWSDWKTGKLYVRRLTDQESRAGGRRRRPDDFRVGDIIGLTLRDENWAEYTQRDFEGGEFLAEEWRLQIQGLEA